MFKEIVARDSLPGAPKPVAPWAMLCLYMEKLNDIYVAVTPGQPGARVKHAYLW